MRTPDIISIKASQGRSNSQKPKISRASPAMDKRVDTVITLIKNDLHRVPPNTSVLFSLPRELLREGRSIIVRYQFLNEDGKGKLVDYAKERELRLTETDLTKQRGKGLRRARQ